jgi:hypothetical protein
MLTISPKHGALLATVGALVHFDDGEVWSSDYRSVRASDGNVRFSIKNTFLPGSDIILDGKRRPLIRFRGFLGACTILHVSSSSVEVKEERSPASIHISFGRWKADYDEKSSTMNLDLTKADPDFAFALAGAHQLWIAYIGS